MKGKTNIFSGNSVDGEYLNISVSTTNTNQELINGATIKISYGEEEIAVRWYGDDITVIIPSGVTYTISPMFVENHQTPAGVQYTSIKGNSRTVNITYNAVEYSTIRINQNISDPDSMITGDINSGHFKMILDGTHRYLAKQTSESKCHIIQLDDANSNYYHNGDPVTWISGMDVVIKIPAFSYLCEEVSSDIFDIKVHYGEDELGGNWIYYDGNCLIDVFFSSAINNMVTMKMIPRSLPYGKNIPSTSGTPGYPHKVIFTNIPNYLSNRSGWMLMPMDIYNILIMLYYAKYGTTKNKFNCLPSPSIAYMYNYKSLDSGMQDIVGNGGSLYINNVFLGLDQFGNGATYINAVVNSRGGLDVLRYNGETRIIDYDIAYGTGSATNPKYLSKCHIGPYMDWLPKEVNTTSRTTGYCTEVQYDYNSTITSGNALLTYFNYNNNYQSDLLRINFYNGSYNSSTYQLQYRKVFHGDITEYSSVSLFENKTDIYA